MMGLERHGWLCTRLGNLGGAAAVCAAALMSCSHAVHAEGSPAAAVRSYSIAAGPLRGALDTFAAQANVSVSYVPNIVEGKVSRGLTGSFPVEQALTNLLAGSGLYAQSPAAGTYVILGTPTPTPTLEPNPEAPSAGGETPSVTQLPVIAVTANANRDLGYHDEGFVAQTTRSATRTDTPIAELAQSVEVVTQNVMSSQQSQSVVEALGNVSGISVGDRGLSSSPSVLVYVRGFNAPIMMDGLATQSDQLLNIPAAGIERIELLKGADAIVAGDMAPGGVVNIVTKKPQADPVHELTVQVGSYGDLLTSVDLAGALTANRIFTYRFVASGERVGQDSYGYDGKRNFYLAPSLGFDYGGTHLVVGLEQSTMRVPQTPNTILGPNGPYPLDTPTGRPDDHASVHDTSVFYELAQDFGNDWTFRSKARYERAVDNQTSYFIGSAAAASDGSEILATSIPTILFQNNYSWETEQSVTGKIRTGPVVQTLTIGFSYGKTWSSTTSGEGEPITVPLGQGVLLPPVNVPTTFTTYEGNIYDSNLFLQDQVHVGGLRLLASVGHQQEWGQTVEMSKIWTPNFGVLYQLTSDIAIYANAQRSFQSQAALVLVGGAIAPPRTGSSVEAGAKFSLLGDRLTMTAAVFRAAVTNEAIAIPGSAFNVLSNGDVSRGFEVDATGRLLPGLNLIASYTFSNYVSVLNGFSQLPKNQGSLWMTYDLQGERWHGWGMGVGVRARSGYAATSTAGAVYPMPGQAQTDASIYYHAKTWSATLGVKNVFDRRLYGDYATTGFVAQEPGRLIFLTGIYDF
jgi:iron complex outermembrane receptor protein